MSVFKAQAARVRKMRSCQNLYVSDKNLTINSVRFTDTQTVVSFTYSGNSGSWIRFASSAYASDEARKRYCVMGAEGIVLDSLSWLPENGIISFDICFEPLPRDTKVFDIIEGNYAGAFRIYGIHGRNSKLRIPRAEESIDMQEVDSGMFHPDTTILRGRILGYCRDGMPDMVKVCYASERIHFTDGEHYPNCAKIEQDGTFCCAVLMDSPKWSGLQLGARKTIPFYARGRDTLDICIENFGQWDERVSYQSASGRPGYDALMGYDLDSFWGEMMSVVTKSKTLRQFYQDMGALNEKAERFHDYWAWKFSLTSWETHLLKTYWRLSALRTEMDFLEQKGLSREVLQYNVQAWNDATFRLTPAWSSALGNRLSVHGIQVPQENKKIDDGKYDFPQFSAYEASSQKVQDLIDSIIAKTGTKYTVVLFLYPDRSVQTEKSLTTWEHLSLDFENSCDVGFMGVICVSDGKGLTEDFKWRLSRFPGKYILLEPEDFLDMRAAFRKVDVPFDVVLKKDGNVLRQPFYMHDEIMFRNTLRGLLSHERAHP